MLTFIHLQIPSANKLYIEMLGFATITFFIWNNDNNMQCNVCKQLLRQLEKDITCSSINIHYTCIRIVETLLVQRNILYLSH